MHGVALQSARGQADSLPEQRRRAVALSSTSRAHVSCRVRGLTCSRRVSTVHHWFGRSTMSHASTSFQRLKERLPGQVDKVAQGAKKHLLAALNDERVAALKLGRFSLPNLRVPEALTDMLASEDPVAEGAEGVRQAWSQTRLALWKATDPDRMLFQAMSACIEFAKLRYPFDRGHAWRPGNTFRLLLAGYNGTRNTGADVRVHEIVRQLKHLFGETNLEVRVLTIDPARSKGYFEDARQIRLPMVFPEFLLRETHKVDGVIACEGSMFKSKFANALSTMMVGALGIALAEKKVAVGYGGEAGTMDAGLEALLRKHVDAALLLSRTEPSRQVLQRLGIESELGTDTAWSFAAAPPSRGEEILRSLGWDGDKPVLVVCPIHAFCWPVRPDLQKYLEWKTRGLHEEAHYASFYFHRHGPDVDAKQARYIDGLAEGIASFAEEHEVFPVLVAMEALDEAPCEQLRAALRLRAPLLETHVLSSNQVDIFDMVSVLRRARFLLSSRYHAIVTSMPGGVPSAGVTMDERIANLMEERKQPELVLSVEDPALGARVHGVLEQLATDAPRVREGIEACVVSNLERMGQMGMRLVDYVRAMHPAFPFAGHLGSHGDPWKHLPALPEEVEELVQRVRLRASMQRSNEASTQMTESMHT